MAENWKIVYKGGSGEVVEKKSRFIAEIFPVKSEEEAFEIIDSVKKKYWDARHNCHAFVIGNNREIQRYSDDGEPGGTAGKPMLDVLLAEGITDCLVVVTRYFGGVLLGTGGLVRAYQQSAKAGIENAQIVVKEEGVLLSVETDYNNVGKIQYAAGNEDGSVYVTDSVYTDKVVMKLLVKTANETAFVKKITEATNGKAVINKEDNKVFVVVDKKPVLL